MGKSLRESEPDEENPEWTAETSARAKPIWAFPELVAVLQHHGKLGRPPLDQAAKKQRVSLYLDPDVLAQLKQGGRGGRPAPMQHSARL